MNILSFFTQKDLPASQKNEILHEKMTKYVPKRPTSPAKTEVLHEKKKYFFTQKDHPAPQKAEVLHEKMPKH